jgi:hypothetical protein
MVKIPSRIIQKEPNEVLIGNRAYLKKIDALQLTAEINPSDYALIQEADEANTAISMYQRFNDLNLQFFPMLQEARKTQEVLATPRQFFKNLINVNVAERQKGLLYDALGNLIERQRLIQYAITLNYSCWVYLNARFPQGKGVRDLDFVTVEADGTEKRTPLMPCLEDSCYAELESINEQGLPTRRDSFQKYEPGRNIYFYPPVLRRDNLEEGFVAGFVADPVSAWLGCDWHPDDADSSLGGFTCAEGAVSKNEGAK